MKKLLLLLLATSIGYSQVPADATPLENIQITNNVTSTTATKVVVQESTGVLNTKPLDATVVQNSINPINGGAVYTGLAGKFNTPTGLTTNYLPKWNGSVFGDSSVSQDASGNVNINGGSGNDVLFLNKSTGASFAMSGNNGASGKIVFQASNSATPDLLITLGSASYVMKSGGRFLVNTQTDDLTNQLQVNGTISASPAVNSNQVVVLSQISGLAPLASPSFTGTPTAPTATAGTNTTQVATTAFVVNADANNVKLTGNQNIAGTKTFSNVNLTTSAGQGASLVILSNPSNNPGILLTNRGNGFGYNGSSNIGSNIIVSNSGVGDNYMAEHTGSGFNFVGRNSSTNTFTVDKLGNVTATSFIKSGGTANQMLMANGSTRDYSTLPAYADNAAAIAGGLAIGALYRTLIGLLAVVY